MLSRPLASVRVPAQVNKGRAGQRMRLSREERVVGVAAMRLLRG